MAYFSVQKPAIDQILVSWMIFLFVSAHGSDANCAFEAIFNFGDSNSDTGGFYAAFPSQPSPNGMTYFSKPTGRTTDGRLYIDFLAQALGLPFLSPYLQSIGSDYRHGVNFATSASSVLQPNTTLFVTGISPFYLAVQINQMKNFKQESKNSSRKVRSDRLTKNHTYRNNLKLDGSAFILMVQSLSTGETNLPKPDIFGKALYTIYIGQYDISHDIASIGAGGLKQYGPQIAYEITNGIKELYALGGRTFLVLNLAPMGCYPAILTQVSHDPSDIDSSGCMVSFNNAVREYNSILKEALRQAREQLHSANIIYADNHAIQLEIYQHPTSHGLQHGITVCCGYGGGSYNFDPQVFCGNTKEINGQKVSTSVCGDPENYVNWDGIHLTENANKMMAYAILSGSNFDPPFSFNQYCDIRPIG